MPICEICKKNAATVHVTELQPGPKPDGEASTFYAYVVRHVCEPCAARANIPYAGVVVESKGLAMLAMLKASARKVSEEGQLTCPDCGMTLAEFRSKGRLGCPKDYQIFAKYLRPLLLRVHNATRHTGQLPAGTAAPKDPLTQLRAQLEEAIRAEAYENAAKLRDEIEALEKEPKSES